MSQIINELATIEVTNEVLKHLDVNGIYKSFSDNYKKLDDLKNFRSEYEKKNWIARWWHKKELRDAQLDSAEVQAEFSKTIGQLMMISIMQSKKITEQQTQLNQQQIKLKSQADGIAEHAGELQKQHHTLAEQSTRLEKLVREYFELKGLTEDGAQKLIAIAREIKATKNEMLSEFSARTKELEAHYGNLTSRMDSLFINLNDKILLNSEQIRNRIDDLQNETRVALDSTKSELRNEQVVAQQTMGQNIAKLERLQRESEASQQSKITELQASLYEVGQELEKQENEQREILLRIENDLRAKSIKMKEAEDNLATINVELSSYVQKQKSFQEEFENRHRNVFLRINRLGYFAAGISVVVIGILGAMVHLMR